MYIAARLHPSVVGPLLYMPLVSCAPSNVDVNGNVCYSLWRPLLVATPSSIAAATRITPPWHTRRWSDVSANPSTHQPQPALPRLTERRGRRSQRPVGPHYKWIALTNTTLGALMATIDASIVLIALPAIFKGIGINPLAPGESSYFLWLLLGYMVVTATLLVTFGRISDMFGRVRLYNLGFAIFTFGSILLAFTPGTGNTGALELIIFRLIQGVGSGFLLSNSAAILTDAFPANQRGRALGINQIAAIAGSFIGLILGGVLAAITGVSSFW